VGPGEREVQDRDRVTGAVTRVTDFGAFVELEKGIEGLIHRPKVLVEEGTETADVVNRATSGSHGPRRQPG